MKLISDLFLSALREGIWFVYLLCGPFPRWLCDSRQANGGRDDELGCSLSAIELTLVEPEQYKSKGSLGMEKD